MILAAVRSTLILTWVLSIQSTLGFQPTTSNSLFGLEHAHSANGVVTSRRSPILPRQGMTQSIRLGIWGSSSSSDEEEGEEATPAEDPVIATDESTDATESTTTMSTEKSLLALANEIGNNFRGMAQKSTAKGYESEDQFKKILHAAKACVYYSLFILYRAYRGFFVLLPATFKQVYGKMEAAMNTGNLSLDEIGFDENVDSVPSNSAPKWRTKVTVSILTSVVTVSYIVGGVLKMASKFFRTIAKTSDVPKSFGAAADEVMNIEGRISRVGKVNGDSAESSGLTP